jgi:hypothetical protein
LAQTGELIRSLAQPGYSGANLLGQFGELGCRTAQGSVAAVRKDLKVGDDSSLFLQLQG